jgi:hypothetical protein
MRCSIFYPWNMSFTLLQKEDDPRRLSESAHLLRYPHPSSLRRTGMYATPRDLSAEDADSPRFRRGSPVSEALYLDIFHQPPDEPVNRMSASSAKKEYSRKDPAIFS